MADLLKFSGVCFEYNLTHTQRTDKWEIRSVAAAARSDDGPEAVNCGKSIYRDISACHPMQPTLQ